MNADGNTYAINRHLDEREKHDAWQEGRDAIETIESIMERTAQMTPPEPKPRFDVTPWIVAAVIVGLVIYGLSYDIAAHVVQEVE